VTMRGVLLFGLRVSRSEGLRAREGPVGSLLLRASLGLRGSGRPGWPGPGLEILAMPRSGARKSSGLELQVQVRLQLEFESESESESESQAPEPRS
jgi:hypothetical protein